MSVPNRATAPDPITRLARRFPRTAAGVVALLGLAILAAYVHEVRAHRFHNDDAFISFRYARHLADGLGLVWNPGERVEGYTNFLWVLLVAGAMKLGARAEPFASAFLPVCGALLLLAAAAFTARRTGWRSPWVLAAPAALAACPSFTGWASSGMETMLFALLAFTGWTTFLAEREDPTARRISPWLLAGAALTRPDGLLFAGLAGLVGLLDLARRRITTGDFLRWAAPVVAIVGAHFLGRRAYYGFWWPNTFYAKVNSFQPGQGLRYLGEFQRVYSIGAFLPFALLPLFVRPRNGDAWLLLPVLAYTAYLVAIGGDTFEFRFLVFLLPFVVVLVAGGFRTLARLRPAGLFAPLGAAGSALLVAAFVRGGDPARSGDLAHQIRTRDQLDVVAETNLEAGAELRELLDQGLLPRDLVICSPTVGALPYLTGLVTIDYHGLNDVRIARMPVANDGRLAHEHEATIDYLKERKVDMHLAESRGLRPNPKATFRDRDKPFKPYWKNVPVGDEYLSFASYVSEERFREVFGPLLERAEAEKAARREP